MEERPLSLKARIMIWIAVFAAAIAGILYDSNFRFKTESFELAAPGLPGSFDGFRIVQLSDLHGKEFGKDNKKLVQAVTEARPDMIALTGDYIESAEDIAVTEKLVRQLTDIAPVYFVSGNHDWASGEIQTLFDTLQSCGVTSLHNEYVLLEKDGESIVLAGVEDPNSWAVMTQPDELVDIIKEEQGGKFTVLLGHRNYWIEKYPELEVDIILCGHSHGGIIRLPLIGGLAGTGGEILPEYDKGLYRTENYSMLVSGGLGDVRGIPRFLNNPQVLPVSLPAYPQHA